MHIHFVKSATLLFGLRLESAAPVVPDRKRFATPEGCGNRKDRDRRRPALVFEPAGVACCPGLSSVFAGLPRHDGARTMNTPKPFLIDGVPAKTPDEIAEYLRQVFGFTNNANKLKELLRKHFPDALSDDERLANAGAKVLRTFPNVTLESFARLGPLEQQALFLEVLREPPATQVRDKAQAEAVDSAPPSNDFGVGDAPLKYFRDAILKREIGVWFSAGDLGLGPSRHETWDADTRTRALRALVGQGIVESNNKQNKARSYRRIE